MEPTAVTGRSRRLLILILAVYTTLSLAYSFADRLKYGPDEPAHFIYIRSIATELALPPISHTETRSENSRATHEGHQPPLYYATMALPYALLSALGASNEVVWRALRLLQIPFGIAWVYAVWVLALTFFRSERRALAATAFAAFLPTSAFMAGVINNEMLEALLFTWSMIYILNYFRGGAISRRSSVVLGLLMGLAILTKAQGLILIAVFCVTSFAVARRACYVNWQGTLLSTVIVLLAAAVVSKWWFVRNWFVHGAPMPQSLVKPAFRDPLVAMFADPGLFFRGLWYSTSRVWGYLVAPYWLVERCIGWIAYFWALAGVGLAVAAGAAARLRRNDDLDKRSLSLLLVAPVLQFFAYLYHVLWVDCGALDQGRLFLPHAAVAGIVAVVGVEGFVRSDRARAVGVTVGAALLVAFNALVIACAVDLYG